MTGTTTGKTAIARIGGAALALLAAVAFALPAAARSAKPQAGDTPDYQQVLQDIAAGSYGSVSALVLGVDVLPALSVPSPAL